MCFSLRPAHRAVFHQHIQGVNQPAQVARFSTLTGSGLDIEINGAMKVGKLKDVIASAWSSQVHMEISKKQIRLVAPNEEGMQNGKVLDDKEKINAGDKIYLILRLKEQEPESRCSIL